MEVLAQNQFTVTKKLFLEGSLRVARRSAGKLAVRVMGALLLAWVVLVVITLRTGGSITVAAIELALLVVIWLWMTVVVPRNNAVRAFDSLVQKAGAERTVCFYEDHLEITAGSNLTRVFYEDIRDTLTTENLLILKTRDRVGILVARGGFTQGDEQTVLELIAKKQAEQSA